MTILALAALLAGPLWAIGLDESADAYDIAKKTANLKAAVENYQVSDESVRRLAAKAFENVPNATIVVQSGLRGWDMEPEPAKEEKGPASIDRLMKSADKRFTYYNPEVPENDLRDAYSAAQSLHHQGSINYDSSMSDHQMGAYRYIPSSLEWGKVAVNDLISGIASTLGDIFAFSTLIHEAGHADADRKGELSPKAVILGEIMAFHVEYSWLSLIDPRGERLAFLYAKALDEQTNHPDSLNDMALKYASHLYEVWGTRGDYGKLEELVKKRGYEEKHSHSEASPVRN